MRYWVATFKGSIVNPETEQSDISRVSETVLYEDLADWQRRRLINLIVMTRSAGNDIGFTWGEMPTDALKFNDEEKWERDKETLSEWRAKQEDDI